MVRVIEQLTTENLMDITRREVSLYAATSDTATFCPVLDDANKTYAIVVIENDRQMEQPVWVLLMARIMDSFIIIEEDTTLEKHLVNALIANGSVPREKIILAYKGEKLPE